jgi:TetR/AcrR family transcriptional regulator, fatty acid metabolism regulator protein
VRNVIAGPARFRTAREITFLRCAYQAIGERGVHRVSLQDIADLAGASKGLILYYFKTKDALVLQTMEWVLSLVAERIGQAIAAVDAAEEKVVSMIDVIFAGPEQNRRFYLTYLDLVDYAARVDGFGQLSDAFRSTVNSLYAEVIRLGQADGAFGQADVAEAATTVRAIIDGLFLQWLQERQWLRLHAQYRTICKRAVLTYLKAGSSSGI